jgi:hypothetical protein
VKVDLLVLLILTQKLGMVLLGQKLQMINTARAYLGASNSGTSTDIYFIWRKQQLLLFLF